MSKELINTQNPEAMKAALSMLSFPHKYFANPANLPHLLKLVEGKKPAEKLIDLLSESQSKLASFLDFSPNDTEGFRRISDVLSDGARAYVNVQSEIDSSLSPEMQADLQKSYIQTVNTNIAEHINGQKIKLVDGELDSDVVSSILDVAWVVQHFALLISGTLTLEICEDGSLMFKQREPDLLASIWFGSAMETMSQHAALHAITGFAKQTYENANLDKEETRKLHARVLSIIPQHWRLGLGDKTTELFHEIADLVIILINIIQRKEFDKLEKPLSKGEIKRMIRQFPERRGLLRTYELVKEFQKKNKSEDRLFEIKQGGLVLGPLQIIRGLIQQMEYFALKKQGPDWHSLLEEDQTRFLLDDLIEHDHLDVLEFELKPEKFDASPFAKLLLDVDFFIRDKSINTVYAVQLKHVTTGTDTGLKEWFKLIGQKKSKLKKGILQLERLSEVIKNSSSARDYLIKKGLTEKELFNLKPIVVHNVGNLDCVSLHNDICLYDLYTFKHVLSRNWGSLEFISDSHYESSFTSGKTSIDLSNPQNVINAYIDQPSFSQIRHFDGAKYVTRSVVLDGVKISAVGIGI